METEQKKYEIAYIVSPKVPEADVVGEAGKITGFIQDANGIIGYIDEPRPRRLAYPINKFRDAYFGWTRFSTMPENLAAIEKKLKLDENIIRFLIVEAEEVPVAEIRTPRPRPSFVPKIRTAPAPQAETPEKEKMDIGELDKKLEEILGK